MDIKKLREILIADIMDKFNAEKGIIFEESSIDENGDVCIEIVIRNILGVHVYKYFYFKVVDKIVKRDIFLQSEIIKAIKNL